MSFRQHKMSTYSGKTLDMMFLYLFHNAFTNVT